MGPEGQGQGNADALRCRETPGVSDKRRYGGKASATAEPRRAREDPCGLCGKICFIFLFCFVLFCFVLFLVLSFGWMRVDGRREG